MQTGNAEHALVVPVDLKGLLVGEFDVGGVGEYGTSHFARLRPHFENMPHIDADGNVTGINKPPLSQYLLAPDFQQASESDALNSGMHLHWALPDALTHGTAGNAGPLTFPHAPDRWVVVRTIATTNDGIVSIARRGWVLESNALSDPSAMNTSRDRSFNRSPTVVPYVPNPDGSENPAPFRAMGTAAPLEDYTPVSGGKYQTPHTALGYGAVAFAATYAFSQNVFGFWDPCTDLAPLVQGQARTLSYVVLGWYAAAATDPIAALAASRSDVAAFVAALESELKWTCALAGGPVPAASVYLGVLGSVPGDLTQRYVAERTETARAAVGNTTAEAFAALLARTTPVGAQHANAERILNLVQVGEFQRLADRSTLLGSDEALHRAQYAGLPGGTAWTVRRTAASDGSPAISRDALVGIANTSIESLPPGAGTSLTALNAAQRELDTARFAYEHACNQLFADWVKYIMVAHPGNTHVRPGLTEAIADGFLRSGLTALATQQATIAQLDTHIQSARHALAVSIGPAFEPVAQAAPRFFTPHDPVIVLAGSAVDADPRYGGDGRFAHGLLHCRRDDALLQSMTVAGTGTLDAAHLTVGLTPNAAVPLLAAAVADATLGDAGLAPWLAARLGASAAQQPAIAAAIAAAQTGSPQPGAPAVTFEGTRPSPVGVEQWSQPYLPLFLQWEAIVSPVFPLQDAQGNAIPYDPATVTTRYELSDADTELVLRAGQTLPPLAATVYTYSGTVPLSSRVDVPFKSQAQKYLDTHDASNPVIPLLQNALAQQLPVMAQTLQGFTNALCQRLQILQMPIYDPLGQFAQQSLTQLVDAAVGRFRTLASQPDLFFNPLRAGLVRFTRLRVIDAFGQAVDIDVSGLIPGEALDAKNPIAPNTLAFPPRVAAAVRLDAQFIARDGAGPTNTIPTTTPIFGWLVYNHVDANLMVYDGDGVAVGSFNTVGELWMPPPGPVTDTQPPHDLANFISGIKQAGDPVRYVRSLMRALDIASETITSPKLREDPSLALLLSRPFALARLRLGTAFMGGTPLDQGWDAFIAATAAPDAPRADAAIGGVRFGVDLGDVTNGEDGVVGFFLDGDGASDYAVLYAPDPRIADSPHVLTPVAETLAVDAVGTRDAIVLFDPHCALTATTGVVPVVTLQLPPEHYAPALQKLAVTFGVFPLLRSGTAPAIPHPEIHGYDWTWLSLDEQTWLSESAPDVQTTSTAPAATIVLQEGWLQLKSQ